MPVRLNVIMIESAPVGGAARRLAEAIVGELIGLAGVDLTLVDSLANVDATSTDKLTLDGITGDVCVLDWQSPDAIASSLQSIEFPGRRFPHPHDLEAATRTDRMSAGPENPLRRIYAFDLSRFADASQLCEALRDLRASREVRTFSLVSPPGAAATASPATHAGRMKTEPMAVAPGVEGTDVASARPAASAVGSPKPSISSAHPAPIRQSELTEVDPATDPALSVPASPSAHDNRSASETRSDTTGSGATGSGAIDLDDLVDQLDEFDP